MSYLSPATFPATTPTVYPATTYDRWVFTLATDGFGAVEAGDDASMLRPIAALVTCKKCRLRDDGVLELSPRSTDTIEIPINDLLATSLQFPAIEEAIASIVTAIVVYIQAHNQGVL